MHTSKCRNFIDAESLLIESVDYRFVILLVAVVDIHPLSCEYEINVLLRVKLNGMQDLNNQRDRDIVRLALKNLKT